MSILLKLDYAKFGVCNVFLSNVIEEKPLGGRLERCCKIMKLYRVSKKEKK